MTTAPLVLRNVRRLEWYIRISAYVVVSASLFSGAAVVVASAGSSAIMLSAAALIALHAGANVYLVHRTISAMKRGERLLTALRSRTGIGLAVSLAAGGGATWLMLQTSPIWSNLALVVLMGVAASLTPVLTWRQMFLATLLTIGLTAALMALRPPEASYFAGYLVGATVGVVFFVGTVWLTAWMLRVLWELDELRQTAPQLAVAEERLRFSRDLHDTFGRTLSVVAVKSELAAELVRRGRAEQAATEIAEVRHIAEEAGREVRAVASGYRRPDLARELDGAKSVLESAGIRCDITTVGPPPGFAAATTLGWVVREAVTNVLRHSEASSCWVDLVTSDGSVSLTIGNDGAMPWAATSSGHGTGLLGLTERVHALGGTLTHTQTEGRFVLTVAMPDVALPAPPAPAATTTPTLWSATSNPEVRA